MINVEDFGTSLKIGYFSHPRHLQNKEKVAALALSFSNNLFLFYFGRAFPFIYF